MQAPCGRRLNADHAHVDESDAWYRCWGSARGGKPTSAKAMMNGEVAPIPVIRSTETERQGSASCFTLISIKEDQGNERSSGGCAG